MSGIVLSASVRQNLLSLQSTAALLATTQNRLSTGKKVNTALDNPTNFFTAAALDNRASDINNLLDSIGNGVQVLQSANTGISSLQKLVDSAKSVANQALQSAVGYSSKSSFSSAAITGATSSDLRGTAAAFTDATFTVATAATAAGVAAATDGSATGTVALQNASSSAVTTSTTLAAVSPALTLDGKALVINGVSITFDASATATSGSAAAGFTLGLGSSTTSTIGDILTSIDAITGNAGTASSVDATGHLVLHTGTAADIDTTGSAAAVLTALGIGSVSRTAGSATTSQLAGTTLLSGSATVSTTTLSSGFADGDTLTVDGKTLTFKASGATGANEINITADVSALLAKIDGLSGGTGSSIAGGKISLHTGTASDLAVTSSNASALAALGLGTGVSQARGGGTTGLGGLTLTIAATGGGTATTITFGDGTGGTVKSLNDLNAKLAADNLQATIDSTGVITITTSNDAASSQIGAVTGTAIATGKAFNGVAGSAPVQDAAAQLVRSNLVSQYNNILDQITSTARDASFNGINLLNGDQLKLTFNETGTSTLTIQGVTFNSVGLGLAKLTAGLDFLDNTSANSALALLNTASSTLRTEASALGSNLSVVQIRQDFSKNLIDVLQTGSSNLTLADTNEEAANSQALSTRQSIAVSALALSNQSQQSVLQLLR
jgi:flagellin